MLKTYKNNNNNNCNKEYKKCYKETVEHWKELMVSKKSEFSPGSDNTFRLWNNQHLIRVTYSHL